MVCYLKQEASFGPFIWGTTKWQLKWKGVDETPPIVTQGELVPQITLNALADPNEEWTFFEVAEIMYRQFNQWLNLDPEHSGVSKPHYLQLKY